MVQVEKKKWAVYGQNTDGQKEQWKGKKINIWLDKCLTAAIQMSIDVGLPAARV